ncbi:MAG: biopolymer transport protein ExbB [Halanaerobiales bacterium]|nr:biopolymer transport protein ExbB [Halanaerobiales bacterium]
MQYLIARGGIVIYPLLLSSLIALTIILERFYRFIRVPKRLSDDLMEKVKEKIMYNKIEEAAYICESNKGPIGKVLKRGVLNSNKGPEEIEKMMEEIKWEEFPRLEKGLEALHFIGKISPSLGLLGTVTGMIKTFHVLSLNGEPQQLAGGISEALITTAIGLIISIPSLGAYYYFVNKIQQMLTHTEKREIELINFLNDRKFEDRVNQNEI